MSKFRFAEGLKVLPVLAPSDHATTAAVTSFVDLDLANWVTFLVHCGNFTSCDSDIMTITARCSSEQSSATTEPYAIPFWYRLSSAVDTDSMGAITAGTSDGAGDSDTLGADALRNACIVVDIDPGEIAAYSGGQQRWASLAFTTATTPIALYGVTAIIELKYKGTSQPSST